MIRISFFPKIEIIIWIFGREWSSILFRAFCVVFSIYSLTMHLLLYNNLRATAAVHGQNLNFYCAPSENRSQVHNTRASSSKSLTVNIQQQNCAILTLNRNNVVWKLRTFLLATSSLLNCLHLHDDIILMRSSTFIHFKNIDHIGVHLKHINTYSYKERPSSCTFLKTKNVFPGFHLKLKFAHTRSL